MLLLSFDKDKETYSSCPFKEWVTHDIRVMLCYDVCDSMLGTYVNIELANPITKRTLLVIR